MPDTTELLKEHEQFTNLLESLGCQVDVASPVEGLVDAVYLHDPMIMTTHGAILLRMAKPVRSPEPAEFRKDLERIGVPILGQLTEPAFADGGDKVWLDAKTLLIGHGYRTNQAGMGIERGQVKVGFIDIAMTFNTRAAGHSQAWIERQYRVELTNRHHAKGRARTKSSDRDLQILGIVLPLEDR
jgi:hypothetical protein